MVLIRNIKHMNRFMLHQATKVGKDAVFVFFFHHTDDVCPGENGGRDGFSRMALCASRASIYPGVATKHVLSSRAAPLVAATNKKHIHGK
jgi:hypothetical protein